MLTTAQTRHLQELHDMLSARHDVGPVVPPPVGSVHFCGGNRPRWLDDITTLELAAKTAKRTDHRYICRYRFLGIRFGRPRLDPLGDYYGLNEHQIRRMTEIDRRPIPDAAHGGRDVWRNRQQEHIQSMIQAGSPAPPAGRTIRDELTVLTTMEPDRHQERNVTAQRAAGEVI